MTVLLTMMVFLTMMVLFSVTILLSMTFCKSPLRGEEGVILAGIQSLLSLKNPTTAVPC